MSSLMSSLQSLELTFVDELNRNDVLCGRGASHFSLGNFMYRHYINLNKVLYVCCERHEKICVSKAIVAAIRGQDPPGRFIEQDLVSGQWYDIGDRKAVDKTSQALRDGASKRRQRLKFAQTRNSYSQSSLSNPAHTTTSTPPPAVISPNPNFNDQMTDNELEIIASRALSNPYLKAALESVSPNSNGQMTDDELKIIASHTLSTPSSSSLQQLCWIQHDSATCSCQSNFAPC